MLPILPPFYSHPFTMNFVVDPNHVSSLYGVIVPIHLSQFNAHLTKQF